MIRNNVRKYLEEIGAVPKLDGDVYGNRGDWVYIDRERKRLINIDRSILEHSYLKTVKLMIDELIK